MCGQPVEGAPPWNPAKKTLVCGSTMVFVSVGWDEWRVGWCEGENTLQLADDLVVTRAPMGLVCGCELGV